MIALSHAYGFTGEPFAQDVAVKDLYALPGLKQFLNRFDYAVTHNLSTVITGEVGAGKSTSLRAAAARMHPAQYIIIPVVATTGSSTELLKQICQAMGDPPLSNSIAKMYALVRSMLADIVAKKQTPILMIDEAHLLRLEVLAQLHILGQVNFDSSSLVPIVLSGQTALVDKLLFHTSKPFASRIVGRTHMDSLQKEHMKAYLEHHLTVAGSNNQNLFADDAVTAIHQSSGGLLRRAGMLARGALLAAAEEKCPIVTGEHVRLAMTEIF